MLIISKVTLMVQYEQFRALQEISRRKRENKHQGFSCFCINIDCISLRKALKIKFLTL